jgi:hypothetical protein
MISRSDEQANQSEIERDKKFRGNIGKAVGTIGTPAIAGPLASRILPFLNEYIPPALAVKGINKVSPKLGDFLNKGQEMGLNIEEGLNFIKQKLGGQKSELTKENRNIIQQYSPELFQFIDEEIKGGRNSIEGAAAIAQNDKRFSNIIQKIIKDHKAPWSSIVESIFRGQGNPQENQQKDQEIQSQQGNLQAKDQLLQAMQALSQQLRS